MFTPGHPSVPPVHDAVPLPLRIDLLGGFFVAVHGTPMRKLRTRQGNRLLALLALSRGNPLDRITVAGRLWMDSPSDAAALALLRRALTDLRDALGPEAARIHSVSQFALRFDPSGVRCDVDAFDRAIAEDSEAGRDRAIELYRGPLMPDLDAVYDPDGELRYERERCRDAFLSALHVRAEARRFTRHEDAAADFRRLLGADPTRESASRALMELLAAHFEDRAGAMAEYLRLRRALSRETGTLPEPATRALYERIQTGDLSEFAARPAPFPCSEPKAVANNLPNRLTRFIGREAELTATRGHLRKNRLVTLTGTGGAGKTRLALQVAAEIGDEFPDGVWLVEYASVSDPALVARVTATALGVRESAGQSPEMALIERFSDKRSLLVLDNCEHLLDACACLIAALLTACPDLKVLATSREPLGITGEQAYRVPSLALPAAPDDVARTAEKIAGYESVRFFVDRAALARPDFALTDATAPAVAQICRRLDGIPLALELAAARLRTLPLAQLADRLDDRFRLLAVGDRTALPRQQTLRALTDWSYDLLTEPERALFIRLSVFVGGWTAAAAHAVCGSSTQDADDVDELLSRLIDKSLILAVPQADGARLNMLETLRQYATEKRELSGDSADLFQRHQRWFVGLAEEAESHLGGSEQSVWLDRLQAERDNLRAALTRFPAAAAAQGEDISPASVPFDEDAHRLAGSLIRFWIIRGHVVEGWQHVMHVLRRDGEPYDGVSLDDMPPRHASALGKALHAAGQLAHLLAEYETARKLLERSLRIRRALGDDEGIASSVNVLGDVFHFQGDYPAALELHREALAIYRRLGIAQGIAASLGNFGNVLWSSGDFEAARATLEESVVIHRAAGNRHGQGVSLTSLCTLSIVCGDFAAAQSFAEESVTINKEIGNRQGIGITLANLAMLALQEGDLGRARSLHRESLALFHGLNDRVSVAYALSCLSTVALRDSDGWRTVALAGAVDAFREAIRSPMTPSEEAEQRLELEEARALIGDTAFDAAWHRGRAMDLNQAVVYALSDEKPVA